MSIPFMYFRGENISLNLVFIPIGYVRFHLFGTFVGEVRPLFGPFFFCKIRPYIKI